MVGFLYYLQFFFTFKLVSWGKFSLYVTKIILSTSAFYFLFNYLKFQPCAKRITLMTDRLSLWWCIPSHRSSSKQDDAQFPNVQSRRTLCCNISPPKLILLSAPSTFHLSAQGLLRYSKLELTCEERFWHWTHLRLSSIALYREHVNTRCCKFKKKVRNWSPKMHFLSPNTHFNLTLKSVCTKHLTLSCSRYLTDNHYNLTTEKLCYVSIYWCRGALNKALVLATD